MIQAKEVEKSVLGLAIQDSECLAILLSELSESDFTDKNEKVFKAVNELYQDGEDIYGAVVKSRLGGDNVVDDIVESAGGVSSGGMQKACDYLKSYTKTRNLQELCRNFIQTAPDNVHHINDFLSKAGSRFFRLLSDGQESHIHPSALSISEQLETIQQPIDRSGRIYSDLDMDKIVKGFRPGQLVVIGGKTSHGKSALSQNLMLRAALKGHHAGLITMEMTNSEVSERIFSMASHVPLDDISERNLSKQQIADIKTQAAEIERSAGYTISTSQ